MCPQYFPKALKIAIIGGGFSGAMVATHLLQRATANLTMTIIEPRSVIGAGVAYSTNLDCHVLNVPVGKMSAFDDDPDHFWHWLRENQIAANKEDFVPRRLYGKYISSVLSEAEATSEGTLERIRDEAISLTLDAEGVTIFLKSGGQLNADQVVLALGNFPPSHPPVANPSFYQSDRYFTSWEILPCLSQLPRDIPVLLVGSGLTMADLAVALDHQKHKGKIYVVSRRGMLPQPHQPITYYPPFLDNEAVSKTIRGLMRRVRQEVASATAQGYDWRGVIDSLRPHNQDIWQSLPLAEKRRFLRHVRPYWEIHRHRVAPEIAQTLEKLQKTGQLIIHAGRILAYQEDAKGVDVAVRLCNGDQLNLLRVGVVINCTGSECDYRQLRYFLIQNLLYSGLVRPNLLNLGLDVSSDGALLNNNGEPSRQIYTVGPPQKGSLWETTAVPQIRKQAQILAQRLLRQD